MLTLLTQRLQDYSISTHQGGYIGTHHSFKNFTKNTIDRAPVKTNYPQSDQKLSVMILERCPSLPKGFHPSAACSLIPSARPLLMLRNHFPPNVPSNNNANTLSNESSKLQDNTVVSRIVKSVNGHGELELNVESTNNIINIRTTQDSIESQLAFGQLSHETDAISDIISTTDQLSAHACNEEMLSATGVFQHEIPESLSVCDTISSVEGSRADMLPVYSPGPADSACVFFDHFTSYNSEPFGPADDLNDEEVCRLLQPTAAQQGNDLPKSDFMCSERFTLKNGSAHETADVAKESLLPLCSIKRSIHSVNFPLGSLPVASRPYLNFDKMQKNTLRRRQLSRTRRTLKGGVSKTRLPRFKII